MLDLFNTKGDGGSYTVEVIERDEHGGVPVDCHPTDNKLCVLSNPSPGELSGIKFNREEYFKELHTKSMGQAVLYTPVIASTQSLFTMYVPLCGSHVTCSVMGIQICSRWDIYFYVCIFVYSILLQEGTFGSCSIK